MYGFIIGTIAGLFMGMIIASNIDMSMNYHNKMRDNGDVMCVTHGGLASYDMNNDLTCKDETEIAIPVGDGK